MESMKLNSKEKEKKFEINLSIEKQKYIDLENQYKKIISDKNSEIKNLELKNNKINDELKNLYTEKNDKNELSKLKEENNKLKANLVVKENQIKDLTKLSKMQELEEKKKSNSAKENNDLNKIKESDIPEIKKIFKAINEKILNYSNELNKLEQNKDMFFHDKFIEISKSNWKNTYNIWNEELNQFKEKHFSTMIKNYSEELSKIKEEKNNLIKKLYNLTNEINKKKIEIDKLSEQFSSEKEIYQIKLEEIKNMKVANDALQKELDLYRAKLTDVENNLGACKSEANITGQQVEYIMDAINSLIKKDKKKYLLYINI
jgi:chromosome segregation ATPase